MYLREREGFHPFGDEAGGYGCGRQSAQEEERLLRKEAFNAGYEKAYYGMNTPYDPRFQEDWKRGFRSGESAAMAE
jgi:hypothetical protein